MISVVILTYNEEKHISRCIDSVKNIAEDIYIVDSFSSDKTTVIAENLGAKVFQHKYANNHAKQFNWALEHLPIKTEWVLRLDADEYLTPELQKEIEERLPHLPEDINGVVFKRRHIFLGKWIKRGTYPVKLLRLFKYKKAICEQRWMDEHIVLLEGTTLEFENDFVDHNLNNLSWWTAKHNGYAIREAIDLLDIELNLTEKINGDAKLVGQAKEKREKKLRYAKQPLFLRSFLYFIYRYVFKLGFLEGTPGFLWHFLQGWWYRTLVDAIIFEIRMKCGKDVVKIREYVLKEYGIVISD